MGLSACLCGVLVVAEGKKVQGMGGPRGRLHLVVAPGCGGYPRAGCKAALRTRA